MNAQTIERLQPGEGLEVSADWPGIFPNIPADEYHRRRLNLASASGLKHLLRTPAHFRHWATTPEDDKESSALTFGKALHCAVLEPEAFDQRYIVLPSDMPRDLRHLRNAKKPSDSTLESIAAWDAWTEQAAGRQLLSAEDYERAQLMGDAARAHPIAAGLVKGGDRETTFRWTDQGTGIQCQARADLYAAGEFLMDVKTCRDASPEGFARAVASYLYDLQASHYVEGIRANGDSIRWFIFLAIESEPPYVCQPFVLDAKAEERGYLLRQRALKRQAECLRTGSWPGYSEKISEIHLPTWAHYGIEEPNA